MKQPPPYQQIAAHYRTEIGEGRLTVGAQVPTVRALASQWNVTRATVAKALAMLQAENLIETFGRGGTRVAGKVTTPVLVPVAHAHKNTVAAALGNSHGIVVEAAISEADQRVAEMLGLDPGANVVMVIMAYRLPVLEGGHDVVQEPEHVHE